MEALRFYTSPCFSLLSDNSGATGDGSIALYYGQVYSGDWEQRFNQNCSYSSGFPNNGIPEIIETLNISTDKTNNF